MGYYTRYELKTDDCLDDFHASEINKLSGFNALGGGDSCPWYDHDEHMIAHSKKFPGATFILDGDGEEAGDVWRKWYRNGVKKEWRADVTRPDLPPEEAAAQVTP